MDREVDEIAVQIHAFLGHAAIVKEAPRIHRVHEQEGDAAPGKAFAPGLHESKLAGRAGISFDSVCAAGDHHESPGIRASKVAAVGGQPDLVTLMIALNETSR